MSLKKTLLLIFIGLLLAAAIIFGLGYSYIYESNVSKENYELYIYPSTSFGKLVQKLEKEDVVENIASFTSISKLMKYDKKVNPGRYVLKKGMSNRELISKLRAGRQDAVNLTFNNARLISDLSGKLAENIMLDSLQILSYLEDSIDYRALEINEQNLMTLFIPNTYKVYWNISAEKMIQRMKLEHDKFWNEDRISKSKDLGLTTAEVYTLASIVDRESIVTSEKPRIAGLYLNRLERGILLQADPTVIYAVKGFSLRRVLNKHLEYDSPYNTYIYSGLPPGPIGMSSISGIDAVLKREKHNFIYMCAKPNGNGTHAFAKTLAGHNQNAKIYRNWLNKNGIR